MTNHNSTDELRRLWQNQPVSPFKMTSDERRLMLLRQYRQFRIWSYRLFTILVLIMCPISAIVFFTSGNIFARFGICLLIFCILSYCLREWRFARGRKAPFTKAEVLGNTGSLEFYRAELKLQLNQYRGFLRARVAVLLILVLLQHGRPIRTPS